MLNLPNDNLNYTVPKLVFSQLCHLWEEMAQIIGEDSTLITEAISQEAVNSFDYLRLLLSPVFNVLLTGEVEAQGIKISLTFAPEAITSTLEKLAPHHAASLNLQANDAQLQSQFTLKMIAILSTNSSNQEDTWQTSVCQPLVNEALQKQVKQERLLNQVITQIRHTLDLPEILTTAVKEARKFLEVDRLLIYQFVKNSAVNSDTNEGSGHIIYEAKRTNEIPSVLNVKEDEACLIHIPQCREKYRRGMTFAVEDIETAYSSSHCLYDLLKTNHVRAKLVSPILVKGELWGLLIAHQCFTPRQWEDRERKFLAEIGEHLAVAIYQAQLFAQVQQQKNTLEQRVIERTQELQDAMLAAQAASQSKSEFLAAMSHELRTPLTCVIGLSSTLLQWSFTHTKDYISIEKQRRYLKTIQESGRHLLELINDILDMSQVEAGKFLLNISEFPLNRLCYSVVNSLQEQARTHQVNLSLDCRIPSEKNLFRADPRRVKQILYNLLGNAIKFTPAQGKVTLSVWRENKQVIFQIEDTGIGIPQHQLPLLFEKFQQLERTRQRTYQGTGLGLALTKQLVELHGGSISVDSIVDKGSTFTVHLTSASQIYSKSHNNKELTEINSLPVTLATVVLVGNDDEVAMVICELLTAADYQVVWLMDLSTALNRITMLQPELVILAQELLEAEINQMAQLLKKSPNTSRAGILALTKEANITKKTSNYASGVDDYLLRPIVPEQLLQKIEAMVNYHRA